MKKQLTLGALVLATAVLGGCANTDLERQVETLSNKVDQLSSKVDALSADHGAMNRGIMDAKAAAEEAKAEAMRANQRIDAMSGSRYSK
ncbi:Lpp/OprI family alanine-zipper lipoprotein [Gallaecimonas sp. GXIMD4217]|uniref:Lpp/OprI family alanine-zipper lipoprotein n=1 Tax=Gallaecimonas sp. GXIMD4217 TaxID=3131927 RepID=UPI00311ADA9A